MHPSAWLCAHLFFMLLHYLPIPLPSIVDPSIDSIVEVLDIGSADVNGNMRDALKASLSASAARHNYRYTGLDMDPNSTNVDVVVQPGESASKWPFQLGQFDVIISSSCFEHDDAFWDTFAHTSSFLKEGGFLYVSVPSRTPVHRFPVDNWRFYADSAYALARWANRVYDGRMGRTDRSAAAAAGAGVRAVASARSSGHLHVLFSAVIPGDDDTTMIFWKQPSIGTHTDSEMASAQAQLDTLTAHFSNFLDFSALEMQKYYQHTLSEGLRAQLNIDKTSWEARRGSAGRLMTEDAGNVREHLSAMATDGVVVLEGVKGDLYQKVAIGSEVVKKLDCYYTSFPVFRKYEGDLKLPVENYSVRHVVVGPVWLQHEICMQELHVVVRESDLRALQQQQQSDDIRSVQVGGDGSTHLGVGASVGAAGIEATVSSVVDTLGMFALRPQAVLQFIYSHDVQELLREVREPLLEAAA